MRLADIALGLPFLPFVIVLAAFLGPSSWNVVIAIGLLLWPNAGRIIRSQVLTLRERGYIESAKVSGCSNFRIIFLLELISLFCGLAVICTEEVE